MTDRRRRSDIRILILFGAALVIAAVATVVAFQAVARTGHTTGRLEAASRGVCLRLQSQRERSNLSEARQYLILFNASQNPATPARFQRSYRMLADTTEYGPPTDCRQAVEDPPHYHAPGFIPYSELGAGFAERVVMAAEQHQPQPTP